MKTALTDRQSLVIRMVVNGVPQRDIAKAMGVHHNCVSEHLKAVRKKLGAKTVAQAAVLFALGRRPAWSGDAEYRSWVRA